MEKMSNQDENIERISALCELARKGNPHFKRADVDELALRVEVSKQHLPKRFIELVKIMDTSFANMTDPGRMDLGDRMGRILSLSKQIQLGESPEGSEEELLPTFTLVEDDRARVLTLCEEMRKIIFASSIFDYQHKRRLSNRVSAIERQVHQTKGLFDVILGGLSDVGEALGKFGNDVKPLTDRMSEVAKIAREGSKEYEGLPAPEEQRRLPPPSA